MCILWAPSAAHCGRCYFHAVRQWKPIDVGHIVINLISSYIPFTFHNVKYAIWGRAIWKRLFGCPHDPPHTIAVFCWRRMAAWFTAAMQHGRPCPHDPHRCAHWRIGIASHAIRLALPTLPTPTRKYACHSDNYTLTILTNICLPFWLALPLPFCLVYACHFV